MKKHAGVIAQVLSAAAVALSLIFVGVEISQNTVAQRAATRQSLSDASLEFLLTRAGDEELNLIFWGMYRPDLFEGREPPALTHADTLRGWSVMVANLRNLENVYLQSLEGVIDQSVLNTYGFTSQTYHSPAFATLWGQLSETLDPRFVADFESRNGLR